MIHLRHVTFEQNMSFAFRSQHYTRPPVQRQTIAPIFGFSSDDVVHGGDDLVDEAERDGGDEGAVAHDGAEAGQKHLDGEPQLGRDLGRPQVGQ